MKKTNIVDLVESVDPYVRETRGYLHQYPEISAEEFQTAEWLKKEISQYGLVVEQASKTGFIATLDTGKPGKTVGLRADIDALPVNESEINMVGPKKWLSKNHGAAHMCGHDGHMAILLGSMRVLDRLKDQLTGKIIFIFEEGEEISSGIDEMVSLLQTKQLDAVYGTHVTSFMPTGKVSVDPGPVMAGGILVEFDVFGKSGHGSRPDLSINPLFATAQALAGLTSAWSNQIDVSKTVTLGLTQIHGGNVNNIIPDSVFVGGSVRCFDAAEGEKAVNVIKEVVTHTARAHLCEAKFRETTRIVSEPVINDAELSNLAKKAIASSMPDSLIEDQQWYASESFTKYAQVAPILFAFCGVGNEALGTTAEHHNEHFDLDEDGLKAGVNATVNFAVDFLLNEE